MEASWDTSGYTLDEHGDGPLALFCEAAGWRSLSMTPQRDPYDRAGLPYEPYDITVAGAGLQLFTLVTPDDSTFIRAAPDTLLLAAGTSLPGH
ncbi:hypothetical protein AB0J03_14975 [Streptomyces microflavus]|uniref:hypothetical protein n=1 Tax=Streptomyces microflavus TaxID=1919 RepID=UPI00340E5BEC